MSKWTKSHSRHQPSPLEVHEFKSDKNPIRELLAEQPRSRQLLYMLRYLSGLECQTVVCEPNYFDREKLRKYLRISAARRKTKTSRFCRIELDMGEWRAEGGFQITL